MPVLSIVSPVHCEEEGIAVFLDTLERELRQALKEAP